MNIYSLFPTAVIHTNILQSIPQSELDLLQSISEEKQHYVTNIGNNVYHSDAFILNRPEFQKSLVRLQIEDLINFYIREVWGETTSNMRITQSWLNINAPGTQHHQHVHANSIISAVFYLKTDSQSGNINFHNQNSGFRQIKNQTMVYNDFTYDYQYFTPVIGDVFLFPSSLQHSVSINNSSDARISLAVNSFYDCDIEFSDLTKLSF